MPQAAQPAWEHLQTFVAVARTGSLTAAAEQLGISQPTAGRHMRALEEALGVALFVRHSRGLELTEAGAALATDGAEIESRMHAAFRRGAGQPADLSATVRISAAEPIGVHAIAPTLAKLRDELPEVTLELAIDNSPANLSRRDADLAIRMFRPSQLDLVATRVGEVELGLFASQDYLKRHGAPGGVDALIEGGGGHTFIGMDRDPAWHRFIAELGIAAERFAYRSDNILAQMQAVRDGIGIGVMHAPLAARSKDLRWVLPELPIPPLEIWLVMHRELRGHAAVSAVRERLLDALKRYVATPGPKAYC
ncbi:MAG: LysR family transcriptional regulator [Myxococcales bacterium]|nr:LysR family transcriptional regulator [Myxococcales bacterium]